MVRARMKLIMNIFLCYMLTLWLAKGDSLPQEDKEARYFDGPLKIPTKYPYIEPKCCNYSTTDRCSRIGNDGFEGHCMPRNETCLGREFFGTKYCIISKHQSCKCCVPTDCERQTLSPCSTLNGTCIGINDHCNGTSVVSKDFCKMDTEKDTCKCCIPSDCPCGQDDNGGCVGIYPRGHDSDGKKAKGRCMKTCDRGHTELVDHTCNKTGGKDCKCCDLYNYCGPTCESPNPQACVCTINGNACPEGYCAHPNTDMCPEGSCSCCKDKLTGECQSNKEECRAPNDYCVEKGEELCPEGYARVHDHCSGGKKLCDCCKSLKCSSIGDQCTGKGSYCIDIHQECHPGYVTSSGCAKPVIINGIIIGMSKCHCCKPISAACPVEGCFRVGSECFLMPTYSTSNWKMADKICMGHGQRLAEPQDPQALSQYLAENYADGSYWIGARGTNNNNAAWVSTGDVIGPDAPWFGNWYNACNDPKFCMYLLANSGCYISNQCLGCWYGNGDIWKPPVARATLCTCNKSDPNI